MNTGELEFPDIDLLGISLSYMLSWFKVLLYLAIRLLVIELFS